MNATIFPPAMHEIVVQTGLFNIIIAASLGEGCYEFKSVKLR